jgi:hypothetical protein
MLVRSHPLWGRLRSLDRASVASSRLSFFSASILLIKQPGVVLPQVDQGTCLSARHGIGIAMPWHAALCPDEMSTPYSPSEPCRPGVPAAFMSPAVPTPLLAFSSPSIAVYTFPSSREWKDTEQSKTFATCSPQQRPAQWGLRQQQPLRFISARLLCAQAFRIEWHACMHAVQVIISPQAWTGCI